jgi:hypothetical protein
MGKAKRDKTTGELAVVLTRCPLQELSKEELLLKLREAMEKLDELRSTARRRSEDESDETILIATLRTENASLREEIATLRAQLNDTGGAGSA